MSGLKINIKKLLTSFVLITIVFSLYSPFVKKAQAVPLFVPVWDRVNFFVNSVSAVANKSQTVKEYILDAVLYKIIDLMIQRMTASTVNWINSGFKGSPAYVTDPTAYFKDIGDKVAVQFIFDNPDLDFLCKPLSIRIKVALAENYSGKENWQCTLRDVYGNVDDFMNNFERGSWEKFFRITQEKQNNPIGAYLQAEGTLAEMIAKKKDARQQELIWGKGFMSFKVCPAGRKVTAVVKHDDGSNFVTYEDGVTINQKTPLQVGDCGVEKKTVTPGSVIEEQLGETLSIGSKKLAVADEINEILNALLKQVVYRVVGGIGNGLRGMSGSDATNNGQVFTRQLHATTSDEVIQRYINDSENTLRQYAEIEDSQGPYNPYIFCRDNPNLPECLPPTEPEGSTPTIEDGGIQGGPDSSTPITPPNTQSI